jgi:hypothetical protein
MRNLSFLFFFLYAFISGFTAQVKIGDNPNQINVNSLLELESINKGFLPPRVALQSVSSTTPLTSTTPAGMLVYSSGGSIDDGYYTWSGAKWLPIATGFNRSNYVLVKAESDFPAASGGVITLSVGVLYEISGTIILSNKINLNGCTVNGRDPVNDKLIYIGGGEMFTGTTGGAISFLSLTAPGASVFNINAGSAVNISMIVKDCYFLGCSSLGKLQGFAGFVYFGHCGFYQNVNGITYEDNNYVFANNSVWDYSNSNTYETFVGTFDVIQILGGDRLISSGNSAIALNITGLTSLTAGSIKVVQFVGSGTNISGSFGTSWEIESSGLDTQKDDVAAGNLYLSSAATTTFSVSNTAIKAVGTTTAASLFRMSATNNRLVYSGAKKRRFQVICSLTATPASNNSIYSFFIAKNGTVLPESRQAVKMSSTTDQQSVTVSCTVELSAGQYIELWTRNDGGTNSVTITTFNMAAK